MLRNVRLWNRCTIESASKALSSIANSRREAQLVSVVSSHRLSTVHSLPRFFLSLQILLNRLLQRPLVRADHLRDLLPALEQQERRHGPDPQLLRHVARLVDVDLEELGAAVGLGHGCDFGGDHLARAAPGRKAVEHDERVFVGVHDVGLVGGEAAQGVNAVVFRSRTGGRRGLGRLGCAEGGFAGAALGNVLCEVVDAHFGGCGVEGGWRCGCEGSVVGFDEVVQWLLLQESARRVED